MLHRLPRNAAQQVQPELESLGMKHIRDRLERPRLSAVIGNRFAAGSSRPFASISSAALATVLIGVRLRLVPLDVDGDDGPAVRLEVLVDVIGVGERVLLRSRRRQSSPTSSSPSAASARTRETLATARMRRRREPQHCSNHQPLSDSKHLIPSMAPGVRLRLRSPALQRVIKMLRNVRSL